MVCWFVSKIDDVASLVPLSCDGCVRMRRLTNRLRLFLMVGDPTIGWKKAKEVGNVF